MALSEGVAGKSTRKMWRKEWSIRFFKAADLTEFDNERKKAWFLKLGTINRRSQAVKTLTNCDKLNHYEQQYRNKNI